MAIPSKEGTKEFYEYYRRYLEEMREVWKKRERIESEVRRLLREEKEYEPIRHLESALVVGMAIWKPIGKTYQVAVEQEIDKSRLMLEAVPSPLVAPKSERERRMRIALLRLSLWERVLEFAKRENL
ncbi:MAG: hypothetical protein RML35_10980 [Chloroherpetonaceae bacterium]|nr:hypothetical protein [Chloroherpetonaceae bacterium]